MPVSTSKLRRQRRESYHRNYWKNAEKAKRRVLRWKKANRVWVNALERKYRNTPKGRERVRSYVKNRHHRKRANGGGLTGQQWLQIKRTFKFRCAYCGKRKKLTQDHVQPLSKGGKHEPSNVVPACVSCNSRKGARE